MSMVFIQPNNTRSVVFNGNTPIEYIIKINNASGCIIHDTLKINMFNNEEIFVPQGFTPNNDGINDYLDLIPVGISGLKYFEVFV